MGKNLLPVLRSISKQEVAMSGSITRIRDRREFLNKSTVDSLSTTRH